MLYTKFMTSRLSFASLPLDRNWKQILIKFKYRPNGTNNLYIYFIYYIYLVWQNASNIWRQWMKKEVVLMVGGGKASS